MLHIWHPWAPEVVKHFGVATNVIQGKTVFYLAFKFSGRRELGKRGKAFVLISLNDRVICTIMNTVFATKVLLQGKHL